MSESISQLPLATQANAADLIPATQGSIGPGTGTTRAVTQAQIIAAGGTVTSNITLDAGGGWSSNNVGKQLLVTTPAAASNPGIGITDSGGINLWGVWNHSGVLTMSVMPAYSDDVTGPINIAALSNTGIVVTGTVGGNAFIPSSSSAPANGMFLPAGNTIGFSVNSVEKIRLLSTGDIWFTGTSAQAVPIVLNSVGMGYSQVTQTLSIYSGSCPLNLAGTFNTQPVTQYFFNQTQVGSVSVTPTTTAYNTSSDYRLKTVYGPATTGSMIDAVPVHDAAFKIEPTLHRPMFLAHELQVVAPWAVRGDKDAVDGNGVPVQQQVDHSALVPALWAELQSLRVRVTALEPKA